MVILKKCKNKPGIPQPHRILLLGFFFFLDTSLSRASS